MTSSTILLFFFQLHYRLKVGQFHGRSRLNNLQSYNNNAFSTKDMDNTEGKEHCANFNGNGWWWNSAEPCGISANLNYRTSSFRKGYWRGFDDNIKSVKMSIRPQ